MEKYQIGFDEGVSNILVEDNPGMIPIVNNKSQFGFGELVALCPCQNSAKTIVDALNMKETLDREWARG